jgi:hypothetical protein
LTYSNVSTERAERDPGKVPDKLLFCRVLEKRGGERGRERERERERERTTQKNSI